MSEVQNIDYCVKNQQDQDGTDESKYAPLHDRVSEVVDTNLPNSISPKKPSEIKQFRFREKEFQLRPSLLSKFFDESVNGHLLHNFLIALFVLAMMGTWAHDFHLYGNPLNHFWLIHWNFAQFPITMFIWTAMFLSTVAVPFYGLKLWANIGCSSREGVTASNQVPAITVYISYLFMFFYYSLRALYQLDLNCACSFIITCENTRLALKSHGFVRENISRAVKRKLAIGLSKEKLNQPIENSDDWPSLSQFTYYMFCPSCLYRDSYPRSPSRRWSIVFKHFLACMSSIYFVNICFTQFIVPFYSELNYKNGISWRLIFYSIFPFVIPGGICLFLGIFYGILHSWLSMFAEVMCFGDRHFYSNWWNSKNMAEYYRNWNLVVHEWLYAYVYRDLAELIGGKWGFRIAQTVVFFLSAVFHEYWFGVSLRMFFPAIFTLYFIFGGIFFLFSRVIQSPYVWNIVMWWNLLIGTGIFIAGYSTEWYARERCPRIYENDLLDIFIPRIWTCLKY